MSRRAFLRGAAALAGGAALGSLGCSTPGVRLDAPYVSTPWQAVDAMLRLARVNAADTVYDLGCGDGRFIIAAAADFGARGVGIDIDPRRITEANAGARDARVSARVEFRIEDLFSADLRPATVVTLFLTPELNAKLAPRLAAQLRPGARVVSYRYRVADWVPADDALVAADHGSDTIYLWTMPPAARRG